MIVHVYWTERAGGSQSTPLKAILAPISREDVVYQQSTVKSTFHDSCQKTYLILNQLIQASGGGRGRDASALTAACEAGQAARPRTASSRRENSNADHATGAYPQSEQATDSAGSWLG